LEQVKKLKLLTDSNSKNRLNILGLAALIVSSRELKNLSEIYYRKENNDLRQVIHILSEAQQKLNRVILH